MNDKEKVILKLIRLINDFNYDQIKKYLERLKELPIGISNDERLIKTIINIKNPLIYRSIIYAIGLKIDTLDIENRRKSVVSKYLETYNFDCDIFNDYKAVMEEITDKKSLKKYEKFFSTSDYNYFKLLLTECSTEEFMVMKKEFFMNYSYINLCHYVIDYLFNDFYHNVEINIEEMFNFEERYNNQILFNASRTLYNVIRKLNTMSAYEIINMFNKLKKYRITEIYYDDIRHMKDVSYKLLVDNTLDVNVNKNLYNNDLSIKNGVPVYYLNGEEFYAIVRNFTLLKDHIKTPTDLYMHDLNNQVKDGYSFSYISNNNINTFDVPNLYVTFLYSNIDYKNIVHIYHSDSYSSYDRVSFRKATNRRNELFTPKSLMNKTVGYNEIVIENNHSSIKPSALLCYDKITKTDILISKTLELPIVLVNTRKYLNNGSLFDIRKMQRDIYIENYREDKESENFTL